MPDPKEPDFSDVQSGGSSTAPTPSASGRTYTVVKGDSLSRIAPAPSKTIAARWTFGSGTLVKADTQTIAPTGTEATEFHIAKPSGWPAGKYKVDISVDGNSAGTKEFEVKK